MTTDLDPVQLAGYRTPEAKVLRRVLAKLVAKLPPCSEKRCGDPATMAGPKFHYWCDAHARKKRTKTLAWGAAAKRASEVLFVLDEVDRRAG